MQKKARRVRLPRAMAPHDVSTPMGFVSAVAELTMLHEHGCGNFVQAPEGFLIFCDLTCNSEGNDFDPEMDIPVEDWPNYLSTTMIDRTIELCRLLHERGLTPLDVEDLWARARRELLSSMHDDDGEDYSWSFSVSCNSDATGDLMITRYRQDDAGVSHTVTLTPEERDAFMDEIGDSVKNWGSFGPYMENLPVSRTPNKDLAENGKLVLQGDDKPTRAAWDALLISKGLGDVVANPFGYLATINTDMWLNANNPNIRLQANNYVFTDRKHIHIKTLGK